MAFGINKTFPIPGKMILFNIFGCIREINIKLLYCFLIPNARARARYMSCLTWNTIQKHNLFEDIEKRKNQTF